MEVTVDIKKMLEPDMCSSRIMSPFREESGDEELSVLPRHTKVIVTGNNRTKSVLVGLQGVVKKAVGLGGWHWLVLKNGVEVKLQRNALSVLEPPTGDEVDDDEHEFDNSCSSSDMGEKENDFSSGGMQFHKRSKVRVRNSKPCFSSAKPTGRANCRLQSNNHKPQLKVNLERLEFSSLWKYCSHYDLITSTSPDFHKDQLLEIVQKHFLTQNLDEIQVIKRFIQAARRLRKNK
ncbi:Histone deacetylase complex subunit [Thalictrum thalictroides]|uniref:Histone deacetylase complex subunit n=1 Tax=Thalictrum thalictroides TaxID=46969 RepID=A0A7J6VPE6_THATH|nr:Histone deacetylase complex subunit [Thalictrum thalictroides]